MLHGELDAGMDGIDLIYATFERMKRVVVIPPIPVPVGPALGI